MQLFFYERLKRLHESNIIHRDLKCANVFISDSKYKLGDLNVSKVAKQGLVQT
jgi:NIMA (never in mitosis gene a)-related kinase